jgi:hypothetical protein
MRQIGRMKYRIPIPVLEALGIVLFIALLAESSAVG